MNESKKHDLSYREIGFMGACDKYFHAEYVCPKAGEPCCVCELFELRKMMVESVKIDRKDEVKE